MIYSDDDLAVLTLTLWGEARGEDDIGVECVADVIRNRFLDPRRRFGPSIAAVCRQRVAVPKGSDHFVYQFSCWNETGNPEHEKMIQLEKNDKQWQRCRAIATRVVNNSPDLTRGATHYCRNELNPPWTFSDEARTVPIVPVLVHQHHKFYAGIK